ncbi:MAG: hypothetical protein AAGN35_20665 [Bacteroidota bacterium]
MFKTRFLFSLVALLLPLVLLNACSADGPLDDGALSPASGPQLIPSNSDAEYCVECGGGCILGFAFTTANIDGNHPQGGYKIVLAEGDCDCQQYNGFWTAVVTGTPGPVSVGQVGGPGSGSIGSLTGHAWDLWNFSCAGGGGGGPIQVNDWGQWVADVNAIQQQPNNPGPIGVVGWPSDWDVQVYTPNSDGNVLFELPSSVQADALKRITIRDGNSNNVVASVRGTKKSEYTLDLSALPDGPYKAELRFAPGFTLREPLLKVAIAP